MEKNSPISKVGGAGGQPTGQADSGARPPMGLHSGVCLSPARHLENQPTPRLRVQHMYRVHKYGVCNVLTPAAATPRAAWPGAFQSKDRRTLLVQACLPVFSPVFSRPRCRSPETIIVY